MSVFVRRSESFMQREIYSLNCLYQKGGKVKIYCVSFQKLKKYKQGKSKKEENSIYQLSRKQTAEKINRARTDCFKRSIKLKNPQENRNYKYWK